MTANTIKSFVSGTFTNLPKNYVDFKEKYCPTGQTCNDIFTLGGLAFMIWFMYIALQPILRF